MWRFSNVEVKKSRRGEVDSKWSLTWEPHLTASTAKSVFVSPSEVWSRIHSSGSHVCATTTNNCLLNIQARCLSHRICSGISIQITDPDGAAWHAFRRWTFGSYPTSRPFFEAIDGSFWWSSRRRRRRRTMGIRILYYWDWGAYSIPIILWPETLT